MLMSLLTGRISSWEEGDLNGDGYFNVMDFQFFSELGNDMLWGGTRPILQGRAA